jgi:hypothetical protein
MVGSTNGQNGLSGHDPIADVRGKAILVTALCPKADTIL